MNRKELLERRARVPFWEFPLFAVLSGNEEKTEIQLNQISLIFKLSQLR